MTGSSLNLDLCVYNDLSRYSGSQKSLRTLVLELLRMGHEDEVAMSPKLSIQIPLLTQQQHCSAARATGTPQQIAPSHANHCPVWAL